MSRVEPDARSRCVLTIAGSDPTGGAGLQLDLQVFAKLGVHGLGVPTALTVQSTQRVHQVLPAFPSVVGAQLVHLLEDIRPDAIKIGMLATDDVLLQVAVALGRVAEVPRLVDPVLRASDGTMLLERRAWGNWLERIAAGGALVTPNLPEAQSLTGTADPEEAARVLRSAGARAVLIKGGHAQGPPDDFLLTEKGGVWIRAERRYPHGAHGTGCALSAAIAAQVALGDEIEVAVPLAKRWIERALDGAFQAGAGQRLLGIARL